MEAARQQLRAGAVLLVAVLGLLVGGMAYQAPPAGQVAVGWLGDRLFLGASPGLGADAIARGDFFADDLTPDSPTGRSRWTREHARIVLPNLGAGADLELTIVAQGWPGDVVGAEVAQPSVAVTADGSPVGSFVPRGDWTGFQLFVPAELRAGGDLTIDLYSSQTFTDTVRFGGDPRLKGVRLAEVRVRAAGEGGSVFYPPAWRAVLLLTISGLLLYLLLARLSRSTAVVYTATAVGVGLAGVGLAAARIWMGAALELALLALGVALAAAWHGPLLGFARALLRRFAWGRGPGYGLVLVSLLFVGHSLALLAGWLGADGRNLFWQLFPDSLLYGLLGLGLLTLAFVLGRQGLPRLAEGIVAAIGSRRGSLALLALFAAIWLGYQAWVVAQLPYVGHADYSDNAVVARNLAAGRGWVVDYVTQFYRLNDGLTRPQETWPLLQPVWIAPFFLMFGATEWAAKLPNLIFNAILIGLVYRIGATIWDRRVGLTAAVLLLTNYLFFRLTIYVTNDLGFTVFSVGAVYCLYRAAGGQGGAGAEDRSPGPTPQGAAAIGYGGRWLLASGALTGLMMLQKPSGAMIAVGMGLWLIVMHHAICRTQHYAPRALLRSLGAVAGWAAVALLILSPYLARNMALFGTPVYSTEGKDAWVLGYRGNSGDAWAEIYRVFAPELGGGGVPDRSWVLRWGFDATLTKFDTQVDALRDYMMPAWPGAPGAFAGLFGQSDCSIPATCKSIASDLGAWLALIGLLLGLRGRRRLLGLLATAYTPYTVFMLTYWRTDEERYWVLLIPWLALLGAWAVWAAYDRLASLGDRRWAPLGLLLAGAAIVTVVGFSRPDIADKVVNERGPTVWAPDLAAYSWLNANTTPGAVVMTRIPWQLNWHTERPALMIPNTGDRAQLLEIARIYGARYLVLENQLRVKGDAGRLLAPLMDHDNQVGQVIDGFELIYASPTADYRAFVYRIPDQ